MWAPVFFFGSIEPKNNYFELFFGSIGAKRRFFFLVLLSFFLVQIGREAAGFFLVESNQKIIILKVFWYFWSKNQDLEFFLVLFLVFFWFRIFELFFGYFPKP